MRQNSSTSDLIFGIPMLVSYLSRFMTPAAWRRGFHGHAGRRRTWLEPPQYLADGDVMELGVEGLGTAKQNVVSYR